jgi:hypothetical protein
MRAAHAEGKCFCGRSFQMVLQSLLTLYESLFQPSLDAVNESDFPDVQPADAA